MILALTGYARSGKDTVGRILVERHGFRRVAFGDLLKGVAEDTNPILEVHTDDEDAEPFHASIRHMLDVYGGWERVKDEVPEARQFLVDLGNSLRSRIPGIEVDAAFAGVLPGEDVVNTNVYHPEEIDRILRMGGVVIRVRRPGYGPANPDEARTGQHPVSMTLDNDGTVDQLAFDLRLLLGHLRDRGVTRAG